MGRGAEKGSPGGRGVAQDESEGAQGWRYAGDAEVATGAAEWVGWAGRRTCSIKFHAK